MCVFSSVYRCSAVDCIFCRITYIPTDLPSKPIFFSDPYLHPFKRCYLMFYVSDVLKACFKIALIRSWSCVHFYFGVPTILVVFGNSSYKMILKDNTF